MHEISGAVDGIDDEAVIGIGALHHAGLLGQEAVAGTGLHQFLAQDLVAAHVGSGHIVARALHRNLQIGKLAKVALHPARRLADGGNHHGHSGGSGHGDILGNRARGGG